MTATDIPDTYDAYVETHPAARFTDWLRERAEPDWTAATEHRFTEELAADTIDDAVFRRYLVQDYAFVDALCSLVGYAVGQAPTMAEKRELAGFLAILTDEEDDYFERSFDALGVPPDDRADPAMSGITRELRNLLLLAGHQGVYEECLAVLLPVEWVYLTWAERVADREPDRFYLREWIELHADPDFAAFVGWLRAELDREGPTLSARREQRVDAFFRHAVELEVAFFDAAY